MPDMGRFAAVLSAFMELSTERQIGMAVGPIPASAINRYLREYKLPDWWEPVIKRIDHHFLATMNTDADKADAG